jgi:hypothetical protein
MGKKSVTPSQPNFDIPNPHDYLAENFSKLKLSTVFIGCANQRPSNSFPLFEA